MSKRFRDVAWLLFVTLAVAAVLQYARLASGADFLPTTDQTNSPVVKPVSRTVLSLEVPSPKKGWVYTSRPSQDEWLILAQIYSDYRNDGMSDRDVNRVEHLARLMAIGAGNRDRDLEQLCYYFVFSIPVEHPAKAFLEKRVTMGSTKLTEGTSEYTAFTAKMQDVAKHYGLE